MKKLLLIICAPILLSSCIKQLEKKFTGDPVVEIDQTVLNSVASGLTYPILTRHPFDGRPSVAASDSTIRRYASNVRIRVNLVGPQMSTDQTIGYKIFSAPVSTIAFGATLTTTQAPPNGQTPSAAAATLTLVDAVLGVHYAGLSGKCTIPAMSSFGYIDIPLRNPGPTAGQARFIGIQLDSSGSLRPNPNYNKIGIAIDQR
jgi:hypothetical protein